MHDPDICFCGEDCTGQCPCPCVECQAQSVDPAELAREEAGARTLLALIEILADHQWKEFERWLVLHGREGVRFFPPFVVRRQIAFAGEYSTMTNSEKARFDSEWEILNEFEVAEAQAEEMCAFKKRNAAKRYLVRMRKLEETSASRAKQNCAR
jgi:hypothetical protein